MSLLLVNDTTFSTNSSLVNNSNIKKNNNDSEFNDIEAEVNNIMNTQKNNDELCKMDVFKNLLLTLQNQIDTLTEEVKFLREDSINKSMMINNLINITRIIHTKREVNNSTIISDESSRNETTIDSVSKFNKNIYNNRLNNNCNMSMNSENRHSLQEILNDLSYSPPLLNSPVIQNEIHQYQQLPPLMEEYEEINDITSEEITSSSDTSLNIDDHEMSSNEENIILNIHYCYQRNCIMYLIKKQDSYHSNVDYITVF